MLTFLFSHLMASQKEQVTALQEYQPMLQIILIHVHPNEGETHKLTFLLAVSTSKVYELWRLKQLEQAVLQTLRRVKHLPT